MKTKVNSNEMEYAIFLREDGKFDVEDAGGSRPLGLRDVGPWETESDATEAVRQLTPEQAAE